MAQEDDPRGIGLGGSVSWAQDKVSLYGGGMVNTSFGNVGDSYSVALSRLPFVTPVFHDDGLWGAMPPPNCHS